MALDFARAAQLFMGSEQELALALGIQLGDVRAFRNDPKRTPPAVLEKLGQVLIERGKGMQRVGELLCHEQE